MSIPYKLKVMIADDELTIIKGLKRLLPWEENGFEIVCEATDGISAINSARTYRPDILIMDINMPLLSGLEAIKSLSIELPNSIFIILSGYNEFEYAREAMRLNVFEYLLKPVTEDQLADTLNKARLEWIKSCSETISKENNIELDEPIIHKIISYINGHLSDEITLNQLADEFHINASYLSQLFKNETGMNYYTYLNQQRINRSKILLETTRKSIAQIALEAGFNDYRVFTKAFKRHENITPSSYRNKKRQNKT